MTKPQRRESLHSASEVVSESLRLLMAHEEYCQPRLQELRKKIAAGIDELDRGESVGMEEVFAELRRPREQGCP